MDDASIRRFLRYYWQSIVVFALDLASLNDRERQAVDLCGIRGMTIEQAAERAECSVNTMQSRWSAARKRLSKAWNGIEWIQLLADTVSE